MESQKIGLQKLLYSEEGVTEFKKRLKADGVKIRTLSDCLKRKGQGGLVSRKFVGYDNTYGRIMIYRVDEYCHNNGEPNILISELTANPHLRAGAGLDLSMHTKDIDISGLDIKKVAEMAGLSTDYFHHYL